MATLVCDFCAQARPGCFYPVREFYLTLPGGGTWASGDRWYACRACARLVDQGDWAALARRCAAHPLVAQVAWAAFAANRTGPPRPVACTCAPGGPGRRCPVHGTP